MTDLAQTLVDGCAGHIAEDHDGDAAGRKRHEDILRAAGHGAHHRGIRVEIARHPKDDHVRRPRIQQRDVRKVDALPRAAVDPPFAGRGKLVWAGVAFSDRDADAHG